MISTEFEIEVKGVKDKAQANQLNSIFSSVLKSNSYLFKVSKIHVFIEFMPLPANVKGSFLPVKSSKVSFYFLIDIKLLTQTLDKNTISLVLSHELAHAADLDILQENSAIYKHSIQLNNRFSLNQMISDTSSQGIDSQSLQWCLLNFIATIRNEGVALLNEVIQGHRVLPEISRAKTLFLETLEYAVDFSKNQHFYKRFDRAEVVSLFQVMEQKVYSFADVILLSVIDKCALDNPESISLERLKTSLQMALDFDVSEWIDAVLFDQYLQELEEEEIELFELLNSFGNIGMESTPAIGKNLLVLSANKDKQSFLNLIHPIIDKDRSYLDIKTEIANINKEYLKSDISIAAQELALNLLKLSDNGFTNPVVLPALNYYLNPNDLISDNLPFIGVQDDWLVLEGAANFIHKQ